MSTDATLSIKDFLPLIGTITTIIAGYFYLSAQARKNRRIKWVDDFIKEVANFSAISTSLLLSTELNVEKRQAMLTSVNTLRLYIYPFKNPPQAHRTFVIKLQEVQDFLMDSPPSEYSYDKAVVFGNKVAEFMNLATQVIRIERELV